MKKYGQLGFTLVEVLVILCVIAIVLPFVVPYGMRVYHDLQLRAVAQSIASDWRLLQLQALSSGNTNMRTMIFYRDGDSASAGRPVYIITNGDPFTPPVKRYQLPATVHVCEFTFTDMHIGFSQSGAPRFGGGTICLANAEKTLCYIVMLPVTGKVRVDYQSQ